MNSSVSFLCAAILALACLCHANSGHSDDGLELAQTPQRVHYGSLSAKAVRGLFEKFVADHKRVYGSPAEKEQKFKIFTENLKRYDRLNAEDQGTAVYGIDRFADMTLEEFKQKYMTLNAAAYEESDFERLDADSLENVRIPKNFDWRDKGAVSAVKDQGYCGSCWAFSVIGNLESLYKLKYNKLVLFSEQQLVDCDKDSDGCNGGWMESGVNSIKECGGLQTEDTYPYVAYDQTCKFDKSKAVLKVKGNVMLPVRKERKMAQYVYKHGCISVALDASAMSGYIDGIAHPRESMCSKNETQVNHGVTLVGYGVKIVDVGNKKKKRLPYWILKNSWNEHWGSKGYFYLYRGDSSCAIDSYPSSAILE